MSAGGEAAGARFRSVLAIGAVLAVLAAAIGFAQEASGAGKPAQGPYAKAGRWITDDRGRAVVLNGWNMVNKLAPYTAQAIGFGGDDVAFLRREGFNTIRLGLIWKAIEPSPGNYDEAYLDSVERTYDLLTRNGFAVMLDFHQDMYNERFEGEGMPDWAVVGEAATLPVGPKYGFPANYLLMQPLGIAYDTFWSNPDGPDGRPLWNAYAQAWKHVVRRFRGKPRLLGYNLFNEPFPGTEFLRCIETPAGCPDLDRGPLTSFHRTVTRAIRKVDRRGIVWYAPFLTFDYGVRTSHGSLGENVGFAYNAYCPSGGGATGGVVALLFPYFADRTCTQMADLTNDQANAQADRHGDTVLNTEFAATDDLDDIAIYLKSFDRKMIGWQQWSYWNRDPCCERQNEGLVFDPALPPTGENVKYGKLRLSARPHPDAVAGTPLSYRFRPGKRIFRLEFSTRRPEGRTRFASGSTTVVTVPRRHYRDGYRVSVRGARVVSKRGARVLRIRSCRRSGTVRLRVTPGRTPRSALECGSRD